MICNRWLSGTESAILNREVGDSNRAISQVAAKVALTIDGLWFGFDSESIFRDLPVIRLTFGASLCGISGDSRPVILDSCDSRCCADRVNDMKAHFNTKPCRYLLSEHSLVNTHQLRLQQGFEEQLITRLIGALPILESHVAPWCFWTWVGRLHKECPIYRNGKKGRTRTRKPEPGTPPSPPPPKEKSYSKLLSVWPSSMDRHEPGRKRVVSSLLSPVPKSTSVGCKVI